MYQVKSLFTDATKNNNELFKLCLFEATKIIEQKFLNYYEVKCHYEKVNSIYKIIHQLKATILHQDLDNLATFIITIDDNDIHALEAKLTDGQIEYKFLERK